MRAAAMLVLYVVGAAAVVYGLWQAWFPLGFIAAGVFAILGAWILDADDVEVAE